MAHGQTPPAAAVDRPIAQYERLGDIRVSKKIKHALWGLNPYCPYYAQSGQQLVHVLRQHGLLNRHKVLDVGCGTGRIAHALPNRANCHGVDVNKHFIQYCKKNLGGEYTRIDVYNAEYNPTGAIAAEDYQFEFDDQTFDCIIAVQVLNHLTAEAAYHYLDEMARMLAPKGVLMLTALLLNERSMNVIKSKQTHPFMFEVMEEEAWYEYHQRPVFNVAIPEMTFRRACIKSHLAIKEPIRHGHWCQGKGGIIGHDLIVAKKGGG